jgi:riboflavin synthase
MFSGIVEATGRVVAVEKELENLHFTLECPFVDELRIDQSIAHNGVCLTVVRLDERSYTVTAIRETLLKSNLGLLQPGDKVNLERSMKPDALLDGHIVQGHVDQRAVCTHIEEADGSWYFTFEYDPTQGNITVEKGSVSVNGVSLTVVDSRDGSFRVAIIPYTYEHTNFHTFRVGTVVNIEFDIVGKYITRLMANYLKK